MQRAKHQYIAVIIIEQNNNFAYYSQHIHLLRAYSLIIPIIILAQVYNRKNKLDAIKLGADEYILGTFHTIEESNASLYSWLRKISILEMQCNGYLHTGSSIFLRDRVQINGGSRIVYKDEEIVAFTRKEFDFLYTLATNLGQVVTYADIYEKVWEEEYNGNSQASIWRLLSKIRNKLGLPIVETVRNVGYRIMD